MNHLNSVLIEGVFADDPRFILSAKSGLPQAVFPIASTRYFADRGEEKAETASFTIEAAGKLVETVRQLGYKGRGVRVVGRLAEEIKTGRDGRKQSRVLIAAEHIEMKPDYGRKITHKEVEKAL